MLWKPIEPSARLLFKTIRNLEHGQGCYMDVYLPPVKKDGAATSKMHQVDSFCGPDGGDASATCSFYHGGAFTIGSSSDIGWSQVHWFLERGFVVVSPEYRLLPQVNLHDIKTDLLDAYKFIHDDLNKELQKRDPSRVGALVESSRCIAIGGSAGGAAILYLAQEIERCNTAASNDAERLPQLRACVPSYPVVTLDCLGAEYREHFTKHLSSLSGREREAIDAFIEGPASCGKGHETQAGSTFADTPRSAFLRHCLACKTWGTFAAGSDPPFPPELDILLGITPKHPPVFILATETDTLVPPSQSHTLARVLRKQGVEVHYVDAKDAEHAYTEVDPATWPAGVDWWEAVILPALEWAEEKALA